MPTNPNELILFANEAFYQAFSGSDYEAMETLWSSRHAVVCIHPGHPPLYGRKAVMQSWKGILMQGSTQNIIFHEPRVFLYESMALVVCYETVGEGHLIAANGFVKEDENWRMVHHQAGPTVGKPDFMDADRATGIVN